MSNKPMTWGPARSGYFEITQNANMVDEKPARTKDNGSNDSGGEEFAEGEWAVLDANGEATKSGASANLVCHPVPIGYERADVRGSRRTTVLIGAGYWAETSGYGDGGIALDDDDFPIDTELTVKSGKLVPAVSGNFVHAIVKRAPQTFQTAAEKALGKAGFKTVLVEIGPRGYKA